MLISEKIGKKGLIKTGQEAGFFVRIENDSPNTGGYLILTWKDVPAEGYDDWVKDLNDLERYFNESGWEIAWFE